MDVFSPPVCAVFRLGDDCLQLRALRDLSLLLPFKTLLVANSKYDNVQTVFGIFDESHSLISFRLLTAYACCSFVGTPASCPHCLPSVSIHQGLGVAINMHFIPFIRLQTVHDDPCFKV